LERGSGFVKANPGNHALGGSTHGKKMEKGSSIKGWCHPLKVGVNKQNRSVAKNLSSF
jgi:hypothetical protein